MKLLPKDFLGLFRPTWSFCRDLWNFGHLPLTFKSFDALWLVARCTSGLLTSLRSRPGLKLTVPKVFGCRKFLVARKLAEEFEKNRFFRSKLLTFLIFGAHADWIDYQGALVKKQQSFLRVLVVLSRDTGFFRLKSRVPFSDLSAKLGRPSRDLLSDDHFSEHGWGIGTIGLSLSLLLPISARGLHGDFFDVFYTGEKFELVFLMKNVTV